MKKRRIAIASTLKPVDDTRLFEKLGQSLALLENGEVFIIGFPSRRQPTHAHITFLPLRPFKRLSLARWWSPLKIHQKIREVKPELLIVNTHELLIVALANRIFFGTRIVYDIQENYYRNIIWTTAFPVWLRYPLAGWVRLKEKLLAPFFDGLFLAEKCYQHELSFARKGWVLENKCKLPEGFVRTPDANRCQLLFTGTIAESTGIFQAIEWADQLHAVDKNVSLKIVGYCAQRAVLDKVRSLIQARPFIELVGGDVLVPHDRVMKAIQEANFGIIFYPHSPHTENRVPTKLYEYLAAQLPVLAQPAATWSQRILQNKAGVLVDFHITTPEQLLHQMKSGAFYGTPTSDFEWRSEELKLQQAVKSLL